MQARNNFFIPGPTNMPEDIRRAVNIPLEDMRAPDFPEFTLGLFADLKQIFKTGSGQIFLFPGSGAGGWEAAITNTLSPGDKVLASRFGQFSHLWIDLCQRHGLAVDAIDVEWGEGVPVERYAERLAADRRARGFRWAIRWSASPTTATTCRSVPGFRRWRASCSASATWAISATSCC